MEVSTMFEMLISGYGVSLQIFFVTLVGAAVLGIPVALGRLSRFKPLSWLMAIYISLMRGTPLMLQMFAVFFVPYYVFGVVTGPSYMMVAVLIAFVVNYAADFAGIYRSGIQSMPRGQYEAAEVLGYSHTQTFFRIILPQVVKRIMPSVTNEVITLVKDTSLAFTLAYQEVFSLAKQISASQTSFMPFLIAGVFYFVANYVVEFVMGRIEKALDYYK